MSNQFVVTGASEDYASARSKLLDAERDLLEHVERVAAMRRALPQGPLVRDYEFFEVNGTRVKLSDLFTEDKPYLVMYHLMYFQDDKEFCPMCSMWVDGWDGIAHHVAQNANIVAATLAPLEKLQDWKKQRDWRRIRLLADSDPSFARDMTAENTRGFPASTVLVFQKTPEGVRHVYTMHAEFDEDTNRGVDLLCPTWHVLDLLPAGRGEWHASNEYVQ